MPQKDDHLTVGEAAELLGVTAATLRNWDKNGKLVPVRHPINGYRRYVASDLARLLREQSPPYEASPQSPATPELDERAFRRVIRQASAAYRNVEGGLLERFEEVTKLLYAKLSDESNASRKKTYRRRFYASANESAEQTFTRIAELYKHSVNIKSPLFTNGRATLANYPDAVHRCTRLLQEISISDFGSHAIGTAYEELIRNTFEKSENQQFFTPKNVVEFMVNALEITSAATICDPASGSGGFLAQAHCAMPEAELYALEIDRRMAWVTQMNLLLHGADKSAVILHPGNGSLDAPKNLSTFVPHGGFDAIITNPPFGSDFQDSSALKYFELGKNKASRRRGALFVERCIQWLKPGTGKLAIVLDDGILNGSANADVRQIVLRECAVEAVISLPEAAFKPYASVKTSILILRRRAKGDRSENAAIFMAEADKVGRKPNGDPLYRRADNGKLELDDDLRVILESWKAHRAGVSFSSARDPLVFACGSTAFNKHIERDNRLDVAFHHPARAASEEALARARYPLKRLGELVSVRNVTAVPSLDDPSAIWRFIGLAQISSRTGEYDAIEQSGDELKSAVKRLERGDVVFAKLRPELRKCFVVVDEDDSYASGECVVFSPRQPSNQLFSDELDPHFLAITLRSDLVFGQLVYQVTGTGRPRVGLSTLLSLRIPLPPADVQREVVAAYRLAEQQFKEHRRRSEEELMHGRRALALAESHVRQRLCQD